MSIHLTRTHLGEGYREDEPIIKSLRHLIAKIKEKQ
jgi:hypothetical protein